MTNLGTTKYVVFPENYAINSSSAFNGMNYTYWKPRMKVFLLSTNYVGWYNMEFKYHVHPITIDN